jgi:hypothetical protein
MWNLLQRRSVADLRLPGISNNVMRAALSAIGTVEDE